MSNNHEGGPSEKSTDGSLQPEQPEKLPEMGDEAMAEKSITERFEEAEGSEEVLELVGELSAGIRGDRKVSLEMASSLARHLDSLPGDQRQEFVGKTAEAMFEDTVRVDDGKYKYEGNQIDPLTQVGFMADKETWQKADIGETLRGMLESSNPSLEYAAARIAYFAERQPNSEDNIRQTRAVIEALNDSLKKQLDEIEGLSGREDLSNEESDRLEALRNKKGVTYRTVQAFKGRIYNKRGSIDELETGMQKITAKVLERANSHGFDEGKEIVEHIKGIEEDAIKERITLEIDTLLGKGYGDEEFVDAAKVVGKYGNNKHLKLASPEKAEALMDHILGGIDASNNLEVIKRSGEVLVSLGNHRDDFSDLSEEDITPAIIESFDQLTTRHQSGDDEEKSQLHLPIFRLGSAFEVAVKRHPNPSEMKAQVEKFLGINEKVASDGQFSGIVEFDKRPERLRELVGLE